MSEERNYEAEARDTGWVPKEEFRGDEAKWVDAQTYVERAEHVMPILRSTNDRLRGDLTAVRGELGSLKEALETSQQTIKDLQEHHTEQLKIKAKETRDALLRELADAKKNDDVDGEVRITDELGKLNAAEAAAEARGTTETQQTQQRKTGGDLTGEQQAQFDQWHRKNAWFGKDTRKTALANAISLELRQAGEPLQGIDFLNKVAAEVEAMLNPRGSGTSKVFSGGASGNGGGSGTSSGGRSFNDLPSDAKAQAQKDAAKFVGPNKLYKTNDEWYANYARQFFGE